MCIRDRSSSCSLKFSVIPGKARRCFNVAVPFAWISRESVRWRYGEKYFERELYVDRKIELFEIGTRYKELVERLDIERVDNYLAYLPCLETDVAAVDDDNGCLLYTSRCV